MRLGQLIVTVILTGRLLHGQAITGSLLGTVTDTSAAVVPTATVTITETNTNLTRSAPTNANGNFAFPNLEPGVYRIRVEHDGFRTTVRDKVEVQVNSTVRVDFQL